MTNANSVSARVLFCALALGAISTGVSAATHNVFVGDNFFSPAELTIDIGDTVRWTNAAGVHNVFSCTSSQTGCPRVISNETFGNGPPRAGLWVYSYTFTQPGSNPYLCQSHASFMHGTIRVRDPASVPPTVPNGKVGLPMTVGKTRADGTELTIAWDTQSCGIATNYRILHGTLASFPSSALDAYTRVGGVCDVSTPFRWTVGPTSPGQLVWWLVVADDGAQTEGSWGPGAFGERRGPLGGGASGQCGASMKEISECVP